MFHGDDGNIEEAFAPAMGALRLFAVPKLHSVSYVTPFAPEPRPVGDRVAPVAHELEPEEPKSSS